MENKEKIELLEYALRVYERVEKVEVRTLEYYLAVLEEERMELGLCFFFHHTKGLSYEDSEEALDRWAWPYVCPYPSEAETLDKAKEYIRLRIEFMEERLSQLKNENN